MANKTQPTPADVDAYIQTVPDGVKRADAHRLVELMTAATGQPAVMWGPSIIGFGSYHYRYASGHEGDAAAVGFSPRASAISLYLPGYNDQRSAIFERLGKHKQGKGCIYIKRLSDVDEQALRELIDDGVERAADFDTRH